MSQDDWQRIAMPSISEFFNLQLLFGCLCTEYNKYNILMTNSEEISLGDIKKLLQKIELKKWQLLKGTYKGKLIEKNVNVETFIISNSSFEILKFIFHNMKFVLLFSRVSHHAFFVIFDVIDFFILCIARLQNDRSTLKTLLFAEQSENYKNNFEIYRIKTKFSELSNLINRTLMSVFDDPGSIDAAALLDDNKVSGQFPVLNNSLSTNNAFFELLATITMFESVKSTLKFMTRLRHLFENVLDTKKRQMVQDKLTSYSPVLEELRHFLYLPIAEKMLNLKGDLANISSFNWDKENDRLGDMEESEMCKNIRDSLKYIYDKLDVICSSELKVKHKMRFLCVCFDKVAEELIKAFAKCKQSGMVGQIAKLKEAKSLVENVRYTFSALDSKNNFKVVDRFEKLINYLSLWNMDYEKAVKELIDGNYQIDCCESTIRMHLNLDKTAINEAVEKLKVI